MIVVADGIQLSELVDYDIKGEVRIYLSRDVSSFELQRIEDSLGLPVKYDARILLIEVDKGDIGAVANLNLDGVIAWQLLKQDDTKVGWIMGGILGGLVLLGGKKCRGKK